MRYPGFMAILFMLIIMPVVAGAVAVDKPLDDPALEVRARAIHKQLRCLVCQNQSIEDSDAELARDLRQIVRERLAKGDSDDATIAYIVVRYGDWVLLQPPFKAGTLLLWLGPGLFLLAGFLFLLLRRRMTAKASATVAPLSVAEQIRLDAFLDDGGDNAAAPDEKSDGTA